MSDGEDYEYRLTQRQRILGAYPFLYTLIYRLQCKWYDEKSARFIAAMNLAFLQFVVFMSLIVPVIPRFFGIGVSLIVFFICYRLNRRFLIERRIGTKFAADFDLIDDLDRVWLGFYTLILLGMCSVPFVLLVQYSRPVQG